jgi:hypothetical protein
MENQSTSSSPTSPVQIALAWTVVAIPLLWGISQTFIKALALFK